MRTFVKVLLGIVLLLVVVVAGFLIYFNASFPRVDKAADIKVDITPDRLAHGEYLVRHVTGCTDCHSMRDWRYFAGPVIPGTEGEGGEHWSAKDGLPGDIYAKNITPVGIGDWTDGELIRAFTEGVAKDGTALFPLMPYQHFAHLAQEDVYDIVAYIRSLQPLQKATPERKLKFPMNLIVKTIPKMAEPMAVPDSSDTLAYGKYLVSIAPCSDCHTPMDDKGQPIPGMDFAGGFTMLVPSGGTVRSANITPDPETGIGNWTKEAFVERFKMYDSPDARMMEVARGSFNTVMPWTEFAGMSEYDLGAIYEYLRTVKPVKNAVNRFTPES